MHNSQLVKFNISNITDPAVAPYTTLTEAQLRNRLEPEKGIFIAESPKVIKVALQAGYKPQSFLCEEKHIEGDAKEILAMAGEDVPVYTGSREFLAQLTGYTLTRGVLCAMHRPTPRPLAEVLKDARRVVVVHSVCDTTNIGSIFRSAAALGMDAVLMTEDACDPLNRRAVRVSMGSVFLVPWTWIPTGTAGLQQLNALGFKTAAMALRDDNIDIDSPTLKAIDRLAIVMGTEGDGLPQATIDAADYVVRIPMYNNVDSLNVAAAASIAFWEIRKQRMRE
ncbi:MAG: RNA methyltransferase [Bacteroidaceae bacterium]|nr:RNA methyltransferase [Bacteroidaceae bacterium]